MCRPIGILAVLWGLLQFMLDMLQFAPLWPYRAMLGGSPLLFANAGVLLIGGIVLLAAGLLLIVRHRAARMLLLAFAGLSMVALALEGIMIVRYLFVGGSEPIATLLHYTFAIVIEHALPGALALLVALSHRLWEDPADTLLSAIGSIWGLVLVLAYGCEAIQTVHDLRFAPILYGYLHLVICGGSPAALVCLLGGLLLALLLSVLLVVASWRFSRSPDARGLLTRWAIAWLTLQVIHGAILCRYVLPETPTLRHWFIPEDSWPGSITVVGGGVFGIFLNLALPVLVLVYCRSRTAQVESSAC